MWICGSPGIAPNGSAPTAPYCSKTPSDIFTTANRIGTGSYDAAGNQLTVAGSNLTYDAENRITAAAQPGIGTVSYGYDGNGRRVFKTNSYGSQVIYVYDAGGKLIAGYSMGVGSVSPCQTCYLTLDHLGSTRLVTDQNGNTVSRHDYIPFGEEIPANTGGRDGTFGTQDFVNQKFTGKERDPETGLEYFGARYYGSVLGRFTSPDWSELPDAVPFATLTDPQTLNLYSYVRNNPVSLTDPTGHCMVGLEQVDGPCPVPLGYGPVIAQDPGGNSKGPTIGPLPKTPGTQVGERVTGAVKGAAVDALKLGSWLTGNAPDSNAQKWISELQPKTQDEKFGSDAFSLLSVLIPGPGEAEDYTLLKKMITSDSQVAEILSGGGRVIAGAGGRKGIEDLPRLIDTYGGTAADWTKISSSAYKASDGTVMSVHAYKNINTGQIIELKTALNH